MIPRPGWPKMKYRLDDGQIEVVDDALAEVLRAKTPAERLWLVAAAWRSCRKWVSAAVASQHPDWDEARVRDEVNRRLLGGPA